MTLLNKILQLIGAYVCVESGTSGVWRYKKYADGTCEIRGKILTTIATPITTAYGNIYRTASAVSETLPFSLTDYTATAQVFVNIHGQGGDFSGAAYLSSANTISFLWMNPISYTATAGSRISILVTGTWE